MRRYSFISILIGFGFFNPQHALSQTPHFQLLPPEMGLELAVSPNAFGRHALVSQQGDSPLYGASLQVEYQPSFFQRYGILSVGMAFNGYPGFKSEISPAVMALWSIGAQIRYQARYFLEQPVVPMVAYSGEWLNYQFTGGPTGKLIAGGPSVGLWFLLNILEPTSAAQMYLSSGILRSYLVAEYRMLTGNDSNIALSGGSYYGGFRFEF
jgi:hypothetical protein